MVQSAAQKPQSPPPPPKQPAAQPTATDQAPQAQAQGQAQGAAKTSSKPVGFSAQDGFEAQPRSATRTPTQGDAFETAQSKPVVLAPTTQAVDTQAADKKAADAQATGTEETDTEATDTQATAVPAPSELDPNAPTAEMTEEELAAYNGLSTTEQESYNQLHAEATQNSQTSPDDNSALATPEKSVDQLRNLLTSGQMGEFFKVENALGNDPQDKKDLHQLVFRGVLPGGQNIDGDTTLGALAHLADDKTKLLPNINRQDLLGDVLHDLNHHEEIQQIEGSQYCSGGNVGWYMAAVEPGEYVREISELAQHGEVQLQPEVMDRLRAMGVPVPEGDSRTFAGTFDPDLNASAQLFGGGFTEAAQSEEGGATGFFGRIIEAVQRAVGVDEGVTADQVVEELNETWGGANWDAYYLPPAGDTSIPQEVRDQARSTTEDMLASASWRHPVMVNVDGHFVSVTDYDRRTGEIRYFDPNGDPNQPQRSLTLDDVMAEGSSVVYQESHTKVEVPGELTEHPEWDEEGGGGSTGGGFGGSGGGSGGTTER